MNVWTYGINTGYIYLASRLLSNPDVLICRQVTQTPDVLVSVINLGGDRGYASFSASTPPAGHPHFPFGYAVEPDR